MAVSTSGVTPDDRALHAPLDHSEGIMMSVDSQDGHASLASLEDEFDSACAAAVEECKRLTPPYYPHAWLGMVAKLRAAEAARRLVVSGDIQTGFERLVQAGRPELTIEWALLDPRWDPLFGDQHREAARWRLRQAGINPPR